MKTDFICPKCNGHLLVGGYVIFSATTKKNRQGLILLSPQLGDYTKVLHPSFQVEKGDAVDFFCPLCHTSLTAYDVDQRLIHLIMIDENSEKHDIYFSGIEGEHCTFKVSEKKYEKYGSSWATYDAFFRTRRV